MRTTGGSDGKVRVWDVRRGHGLATIQGFTPGVVCQNAVMEMDWAAAGTAAPAVCVLQRDRLKIVQLKCGDVA